MEIERCHNSDCKRPYSIDEIGGGMPGSKEPEEIQCPHCRYTYTQRSNGSFRTHPLPPEVEEKYNREHPI
jgi:transposase-like protein